jgi:hypothetical protein
LAVAAVERHAGTFARCDDVRRSIGNIFHALEGAR